MTTTSTNDTRLLDALREVVDNATVGKVFGAPVEHAGTVVLPVAKVGGGGGGGSGTGPAPEGQENGGTGGGLGISAKPLGVFVLSGDKVSWHPAIDVNRVVLGGQVVAVAALLLARALVKSGALGAISRRPGRPPWKQRSAGASGPAGRRRWPARR